MDSVGLQSLPYQENKACPEKYVTAQQLQRSLTHDLGSQINALTATKIRA
jgi:hypothetical protein